MNTAGWMLTENGRQPWIVQGLMKTVDGVSPNISSADIWISLGAFVLIYAALGLADGYLMIRYARARCRTPTVTTEAAAATARATDRQLPATSARPASSRPSSTRRAT